MDNITHSLIGIATAQAAIRFRKKATPSFVASTGVALSIAANNFPDLDALLTPLAPHPLGYLLHHRGFTHTLIGAIPQAALLIGLVWGWFRLKRWSISRAHWSWLWGLACVGTGFHIFADSWNSYGVHPFWPIDNSWYYGDCVFILEPTLWLLLLPATAAQTRLYRWRALAAFLGVGILALGLSTGFTTPLAATALGTAAFGWTVMLRRLRPQAQSLATALGLVALLAFWKTTATYAKHVIAQSPEVLAQGTLLDISTVPFPAHPICWQVSLSQVSTDGALYRVRSGTLSLAPGLVAASKCPSRTGENPLSSSSQWAWFSEFEGSVTDLKAHAKQCRAEAFLRFARMPVWTRTTMTDARFFRGARFPNLDLSSTECPSYVPPWDYPLSNHREHFDLNQ